MSASPPDVRFRVGSQIDLDVGGEPARLSPTQAAYLLLLAHDPGEPFKREEVIRLMWSGEDDAPARHRVRQLTYSVNRKAGRDVIRVEGSRLAVHEAVKLDWDGTPFWEMFDPPTAEYGDYLSRIADRLERAEELDAIRELDAARMADSPEGVLEALARGKQPPGAWRDLLWALLRTGRIREAEFEMKRLLGDEGQKEGQPIARQLARAADDLLSLASAGSGDSLPLLGRSDVMRRLHEKVLAESPCIIITGVRGVGRSRVLGQALATIMSNQEDAVLLSATGSPSERNVPFGGLEQLLDDEVLIQAFRELGQPETEVIRRALPVQYHTDDSHVLAPLGGPGSYLRVAKSVATLIQKAFGSADTVLVIDDLEEIDRSTLEVVTRLVLVSDVRLLATWCIDDEASHNDLLFRLQDLSPDLLHLRDLHHDDAVALAQTLSNGMSDREAHDIAGLSGGRPGRIVELVRALGGMGPNEVGEAASLDELLRRRVREMTPGAQDALVAIAISSGRIRIAELERCLSIGTLEAAGLLRELDEKHIVELDDDRAHLSAKLLKDFVLRELPESVIRSKHRLFAEALLAAPDGVDPGTIANHLSSAGLRREASVWCLDAGHQAKMRTAYSEAIHFLEQHFEYQDSGAAEVAKDLGSLHSGMGQFQESSHWYRTAADEYSRRREPIARIECELAAGGSELEVLDDPTTLLELAESRLELAHVHQSSMAAAQALDLWLKIADYWADTESLERGKAALEQLLHQAPECPHVALVGSRLAYLGSPEKGCRLARRAYLKMRRHPHLRLLALNRLVLSLWVSGRLGGPRGEKLIAAGLRLAQGSGDLAARFNILANTGAWLMDQERWDEAVTSFDRAEDVAPKPNLSQRLFLETNRAIVDIRTNRFVSARERLRVLKGLGSPTRTAAQLLISAIEVLCNLESGQLRSAAAGAAVIRGSNLSFPFAANIALVPEALAEYDRRCGRLEAALAVLQDAAISFSVSNQPAAALIEKKLLRLRGTA